MRYVYGTLLILLLLLGGYWWYGSLGLACKTPVYYSIGQFDERFDISKEEARTALAEAEAIWEKDLNREDIFTYQEDALLKVNFVYDERQRQAAATEKARDDLETRGEASVVLTELHRQLVEEYRTYEEAYESQRVAYEKNLAAYNAKVERYNNEGGAPPDAYESLESERKQLDRDRSEINELGEKLNDLSEQINEIGEKGNALIGEYNERVNQFNDTFVSGDEFTQGDYRSRQINIYTFTNHRELVLVLAHELGHALAIDHVENPASIMYYLMGGQGNPPHLTVEDLQGFAGACELGTLDKLLTVPKLMYNSVIN